MGHGTFEDVLTPTPITSLAEHHIVAVALGSGDAHSLCVTAQGLVLSWGDGDYGKLGRGGAEGSKVPRIIEQLQDVSLCFKYGGVDALAVWFSGGDCECLVWAPL